MAVKKDPQLVEHLEGRGPGAHLRNAREEAGMSVDAVAEALLLQPRTLELLEADAHDRLPAPTFVRGYLRGYARVLGLPSGPILDMYDRQGFEPPPLSTDVTESTQAHTSDIPVRLVTYAVAVVLALLVGLWWHSQEDGGFGIGGDLFDWSPDAGRNSSLPTADGSGTASDEADTGEESVALASDGADEAPPEEEPRAQPRAGEAGSADPASADATLAGTGTEDAPVAMPSLPPDSTPGAGESSLAPGAAGASRGEDGVAESEPVDGRAESTPVAVAALQPDTAPGDVEYIVAAPAGGTRSREGGTPEAVPAAGAGPEGASVATASLRPGTVPDSGVSAPAAVVGAAAATGEARPDAVAGTRGVADSGAPAGSGSADGDETPVPEISGAAEPAAESAGASLADAPATGTNETAPGARADSTAVAGTARSGLVLEFVHESWVEVYDRERARLFFNLAQPGSVLSFDGPRPFDVLLGFGKDVRVTIDGEAFDHTQYLRHGVARFRIGSESTDGTSVAESGGVTMPAPDAPPEPTPRPDRDG